MGDNPCTGGNKVFCDDNCRTVSNPNQADTNNNGFGDACTAIWYVDAGIGASGDGISWATAKKTIQEAIDAAGAGDEVFVASGTYYENIDFKGKEITVKSQGGAVATIIDANSSGSVVTFKTNETVKSILDGFTIRGGTGSTGGIPPRTGGGIKIQQGSPTIKNCIIRDNVVAPISFGAYGGGIFVMGMTSAPIIQNCLIFNNSCTGSGYGGGVCIGVPGTQIINCTIYNNSAAHGGGINFPPNSNAFNVSIINSIVWGNNSDNLLDEGDNNPPNILYSHIDGADPLFVDPTNGDFRLQPVSPCIDAGISDNAPLTDLAGNPRFDLLSVANTGGGSMPYYDMGAFEFTDTDTDGINDDGDNNGVAGDHPCTGGNTVFCDDNCPTVSNPSQADANGNGIGDACETATTTSSSTTTSTIEPTTTTTTINLNDGLVAYYPFNGNANDASGHGYNGIVNGATLTTDRFENPNSAYSFNGAGANIAATFNGILGSSPRTISLWSKTINTNHMYALSYGKNSDIAGSTFRCGLNYPVEGSGCGGSIPDNPGVSIDTSHGAILYDATVSDNIWHHFVWVVPSIANPKVSDVLIYMDGVLLSSIRGYCVSNTIAINTQQGTPLIIGKYFDTILPGYFNGQIDDVRIYNRALSNTEIQELYHFSNPRPVPDTGQTQSYTNTFGEDHDYTINPPSYTDLGNGIVRDNVTGLQWVKDGNLIATRDPGFDADITAGDGAVTWQHALDYVVKLNNENYLGHNDWRLPTIKELSTLVDSSIPDSSQYPGEEGDTRPSINPTFFPNTVQSDYWSSTTHADRTDLAWAVRFSFGGVSLGSKINNYVYYVRAVRGVSLPDNNFIDNHDGTISDTNTGLMWQKVAAPSRYTWEQAINYCENLILNNDGTWTSGTPNASGAKYSDWRLPNRNELQSINDYGRYNQSINTTYFPGTGSSSYWSSTSHESLTYNRAWVVNLSEGLVLTENKTDAIFYVRPVRAGQCGLFGDSDWDGICDDGTVTV